MQEALRRAGALGKSTVTLKEDDPLVRLAGIINVPDTDAGMLHDAYFGGEAAETEG